MQKKNILNEISSSYPGRGIIVGRSADGKTAIVSYFIMGRSENSRNRIFVLENDTLRTQAFDPSKVSDPSLIIYAPVRVLKKQNGFVTIVTNGDQTDTIYDGMAKGLSFEESLRERTFEPDEPNFTPRISCVMNIDMAKPLENRYGYSLSILKSDDGNSAHTNRFTFDYENPACGTVRFLHTYSEDKNPLPSFYGEPCTATIEGEMTSSIENFSDALWQNLNAENKISLFTRFINLETGESLSHIINKHC